MSLIFRLTSAFGAVCVGILVLMTAVAVLARYIFGVPFAWTEEVSGILMIWIVMVGAISCEANRQHLTIDLLENAMKGLPRRLMVFVVNLASVGLLAFMSWQGWALAKATAFKKTQILGVSWFWLDLAIVIGAGGTALVMAWRLYRPDAAANAPAAPEHKA